MIPAPDDRVVRALRSLQGLAIGDAFGQQFFRRNPEPAIRRRELPAGPWRYTDDTVMAISIVEVLARAGRIDRDLLGTRFADRYVDDPMRGYGPGAHAVLGAIAAGTPWREASAAAFGGAGSFGNDGAMRVAPVGAFHAEDLDLVVADAAASAAVTHAHPEGQAGAVAVAVAAALLARGDDTSGGVALLRTVHARTPAGDTRDVLGRACELPLDAPVPEAAARLGTGARVISADTVPFTIWCAARAGGDFEEAMWTTVAGLGDRDTTCAIVGGILGSSPATRIPDPWVERAEPVALG
jgi:ADP-ribosylglycohydrolase